MGNAAAATVLSNQTTDYAPPNAPTGVSAAPVNDGTTTELAVTWTASATDATHDAATGYYLQYRTPSGSGTWSSAVSVGNVTSYPLSGLTTGASYDVQVRAVNGSTTSPGAWSSSATASTYSTALSWNTQQSTLVHGGAVGIFNVHATPNPTGSNGVNFIWSTSATVNTNTGPNSYSRISGSASGDNGYPILTNVWGAYVHPPASAGTYYLWALASDGSGGIISAAVNVT